MDKDVKLTALKEILYGAGISFVLGMIGYVLMFFFKLLAARHFGPEQFGFYEMVVTILGVMFVFSGLGLGSGIQRYASLYLDKKNFGLLRGYRIFCFVSIIFSTIFFSLLLFFFYNTITNFFNFPSFFYTFLKVASVGIPLKIV